MSTMTKILLGVAVVALTGAGWWIMTQRSEEGAQSSNSESRNTSAVVLTGTLDDVTGGDTVRGINTGGNAQGFAEARFEEGEYSITVTFENLPDPVGTDFYEGWVVRRGVNFKFESTGRVALRDGHYVDTFTSSTDLTDHDFYVLTLEPDDGDPAPADHIVEGPLQ